MGENKSKNEKAVVREAQWFSYFPTSYVYGSCPKQQGASETCTDVSS